MTESKTPKMSTDFEREHALGEAWRKAEDLVVLLQSELTAAKAQIETLKQARREDEATLTTVQNARIQEARSAQAQLAQTQFQRDVFEDGSKEFQAQLAQMTTNYQVASQQREQQATIIRAAEVQLEAKQHDIDNLVDGLSSERKARLESECNIKLAHAWQAQWQRRAEAAERDYANCKLTLNDERYCHGQTIAQLKNAASEEIKAVERRLRKVEDELKQMMSDKDSLSDYGDPGLIKVVTYEEALRWKLLEAQQEIENKEQT